jgi:hypothetical protein
MVFRDDKYIIWNKLSSEYYAYQEEQYKKEKLILWHEFLDLKNLGIKHKKYDYGHHPDIIAPHEYEIVDDKKWLITKLKYGL